MCERPQTWQKLSRLSRRASVSILHLFGVPPSHNFYRNTLAGACGAAYESFEVLDAYGIMNQRQSLGCRHYYGDHVSGAMSTSRRGEGILTKGNRAVIRAFDSGLLGGTPTSRRGVKIVQTETVHLPRQPSLRSK